MSRSRDVANIDTILTTKGDIYAATAASTPSRLGVGTNGQVLTAASTTATGLQWTTPSSGGGFTLINSGGTAISGNTTVSSIGGYTHLMFVIEGASRSSGSGVSLWIRFNSDSGTNYAIRSFGSFNNATANSGNFNNSATEFEILFRYGNNTNFNNGVYAAGWVYRYGVTTPRTITAFAAGTDGTVGGSQTPAIRQVTGTYGGSSAITSITIGADGTLDGGRIYVYGVN